MNLAFLFICLLVLCREGKQSENLQTEKKENKGSK